MVVGSRATPVFLVSSFFKGLFARIKGGASDVIIGGNGLVEMGTFLAILLGTAIGGVPSRIARTPELHRSRHIPIPWPN